MGVYSGREGGDLSSTAILTVPEEVQLMLRLNGGRVLSVTLNDDEESSCLTMGFGGVVGTVTW